MSLDRTIVEVRRVLWRTFDKDSPLLPRLRVTYADGHVEIVAPGDVSLADFKGEYLPYELEDELLLITEERDRRIAAGIEYPAGSGRVIQTRKEDRENITQQMLRALTVKDNPAAWGNRQWIDKSNKKLLPLSSPQDMINLAIYVGDFKEKLIYKAFEIKQKRSAGIPVDWTSDEAWQDDN